MEKDCGIYIIKNIVNGKFYIGSSNNIDNRWKQHIYELNNGKHHSYKLQEDWNKYKEQNFRFDILECTNEDNLKDCEQKWLDLLNPHLSGYNILDVSDITKLKSKNINSHEINKNEPNVKIHMKIINKLIEELTYSESWFILFLLQFLNSYDCILKYNNVPITIEDIINLTGLKKSIIYDLIKTLINKEVLLKSKIQSKYVYLVNPFIFMNGKRINTEALNIFKDSKWNK